MKRQELQGLIAVTLAVSVAASSIGYGLELPKLGVPLPTPRPAGIITGSIDNSAKTSALPARVSVVTAEQAAAGGNLDALKSGFDGLSRGDVNATRKAIKSLPTNSLDRRILEWSLALNGGEEVSSREIATLAGKLAGWPGVKTMRRNSEKALFRDKQSAKIIIGAFGGTPPSTPEGAIVLTRALLEIGDKKGARKKLASFWRNAKMDAKFEAAILKEFGRFIPSGAHRFRMERMLYDDRVRSAGRVAKLAGAEALFNAWSAVIRRKSNAGKLLRKVPQNQQSAGYLFAKAQHQRRQEKFADAAKTIAKAPSDQMRLVDPDEWWTERRVLARELVDIGEVKLAYQTVSRHAAASAGKIADAEFHSGWYALRALRDPKAAALHFSRIAEISKGPISRARAFYWMGRAAEDGGPGDPGSLYAKAARYGTSFYGQLAAAKLGRNTIEIGYPRPSDADRETFELREAVHAIRRIEAAGHEKRANLLYRSLARELKSSGELALLAVMAERRGDHRLALHVGKIAAARGINIGALAHPLGAIPAAAKIDGSRALAYAVARQESEFNTGAVSKAGARGLLQLMPGTAKDVARKTGVAFSKQRLTSDAGYNASLGSAYLQEQLSRFGGSYVLTFAAYNAGPRRAEDWIKRYGDPRKMSTERVIDWIERIPFSETRNYVQRVMENYQVYKLRLSGSFDIAGDLKRGR